MKPLAERNNSFVTSICVLYICPVVLSFLKNNIYEFKIWRCNRVDYWIDWIESFLTKYNIYYKIENIENQIEFKLEDIKIILREEKLKKLGI